MLLADPTITVQSGAAGELHLAGFSAGLFAEDESSEELRATART